MQRAAVPPRPPPSTYQAFTMLLEALGGALDELPPSSQGRVASHMLQEAESWPLTSDVDRLSSELCAPMTAGMRYRALAHKKGTGFTVGLAPSGATSQSTDRTQATIRTAGQVAAPSSREQPGASGASYDRMAEVLVTAASSVQQVSARMPALLVPDGECVAFTVVASLRAPTMTSPELPNCNLGWLCRRGPVPHPLGVGAEEHRQACQASRKMWSRGVW